MTRPKRMTQVITKNGVALTLWVPLVRMLLVMECAENRDGEWVIDTTALKVQLAENLIRGLGESRRAMLLDIVAQERAAMIPLSGPAPTLRAAVAASRSDLAEQVAKLGREGYEAVTDVALYEHDNGMMVLNYLVQVMRKADATTQG